MRTRGLLLLGFPLLLAASDNPLAGVRLGNPRGGDVADQLTGLARCLDRREFECIDSHLDGSEMLERTILSVLADAMPEEKSGLVDYYAGLFVTKGQVKVDRGLGPGLLACEVALHSAAHGRCDLIGKVRLPPLPATQAAEKDERYIDKMVRALSSRNRKRRADRLVCGPLVIGKTVYVQEAIVVTAQVGPGFGRSIVDIRCKDIDLGDGAAGADLIDGPSVAAALTAILHAAQCLEERDPTCQQQIAPLSMLAERDLRYTLALTDKKSRQAFLTRAQAALVVTPSVRVSRVRDLLEESCDGVERFGSAEACTVSGLRKVPGLRALPKSLSGSEAAQVKALALILWGKNRGLSLEAREVRCDDLEAFVVYARPKSGPPVLIDLRCEYRPGP